MKHVLGIAIAALMISRVPAWALFETNKELSEKAHVTMIEALKTAEKEVPGKPVEVSMGKDDGRVVYKNQAQGRTAD